MLLFCVVSGWPALERVRKGGSFPRWTHVVDNSSDGTVGRILEIAACCWLPAHPGLPIYHSAVRHAIFSLSYAPPLNLSSSTSSCATTQQPHNLEEDLYALLALVYTLLSSISHDGFYEVSSSSREDGASSNKKNSRF